MAKPRKPRFDSLPRTRASWDRGGYQLGGDAVKIAGSERAAAGLIRRQLHLQGDTMDDRDRERSEKALARLIKGHHIVQDFTAGEKYPYREFLVQTAESKSVLGHSYFSKETYDSLRSRGFMFRVTVKGKIP